MLRFFILQAITTIGAHRNIVVLLKISVFVYIFFVPAGHLSGTISCAAPSPKSWVDPSWDRPSQKRAWAPPNFGTFSCARAQWPCAWKGPNTKFPPNLAHLPKLGLYSRWELRMKCSQALGHLLCVPKFGRSMGLAQDLYLRPNNDIINEIYR